MNKYMNIFSCALLITSMLTMNAVAEELGQEKKDAIDELLLVTGSSRIGTMFGNAFIDQMTMMLKQSNPDIDPKAFDIVNEEVAAVMQQEMVEKKALNEISYPVYHKYLSLDEINELIRFYKSPVGQKMIAVMPEISREAVQGGQQLAQQIAPIIQERIRERFQKEGILLNK